MSTNIEKLKDSEKKIIVQALYESAKKMDGEHPAVSFIDGLLTESEKITLGRRICIAQMILAGKTRMEICGTLLVSPNTVTLTRQWLSSQLPEYGEVIKRRDAKALKQREAREKKHKRSKEFVDPISFRGMRQKYPAHFLFFNLAEELLRQISKTKK